MAPAGHPPALPLQYRYLLPPTRTAKEYPTTSASQLGYIGIGTSDDTAWKDLATDILGMQVAGQIVHAARVPAIARMR
jgi:Dihydroxybiphenyl dioxygenase BphC D1